MAQLLGRQEVRGLRVGPRPMGVAQCGLQAPATLGGDQSQPRQGIQACWVDEVYLRIPCTHSASLHSCTKPFNLHSCFF